jgi:predicted Zn-dependent peptidase
MHIFDKVQISHLDNGFTVITDYQPEARLLYTQMIAFAGGLHDAPDKLGTAHFLEHMWKYGHPELTRQDYDDFNRRNGISSYLNFATHDEYTRAFASGTAGRVKQWMDVVGDMLGQMTFTPDDVEKERGAIVQEMSGIMSGRSDLHFWKNRRALYGEQQFSQYVGGIPEHLEQLKFNDLTEFYKQHYTGRNMALVTSGPMSHEEVLAFAQEKFAHLPEGTRNKRIQTVFKPKDVFLEEPEKKGAEIVLRLRFNAEAHRRVDDGNIAVLREYLSRALFDELRSERSLVYSAGAGSEFHGVNGSVVHIGAEIKPEKLPQVFEVMQYVLEHLPEKLESQLNILKEQIAINTEEEIARSYDTPLSRGDEIRNKYFDEGSIIEPYDFFKKCYDNVSMDGICRVFNSLFVGQTPAMLYKGDVTSVKLPSGDEVKKILAVQKLAR